MNVRFSLPISQYTIGYRRFLGSDGRSSSSQTARGTGESQKNGARRCFSHSLLESMVWSYRALSYRKAAAQRRFRGPEAFNANLGL
jgi:hypothetical protein